MFQADVTATIDAAMSNINPGGSDGPGGGTHRQNHEGSRGHQKECSYKDFMNAKPTTFDGKGGVIALTKWF